MRQAETLSPLSASPASLAGTPTDPARPARHGHGEPMFHSTPHAMYMDGRHLTREDHDVALGQLQEAIRLAELRGKSELLISNIAPWARPGESDLSRVPEMQERIEDILAEACARLGREMPETRLSLHFGEFHIRCYMGRERPTDHIHEEDWLSDSR